METKVGHCRLVGEPNIAVSSLISAWASLTSDMSGATRLSAKIYGFLKDPLGPIMKRFPASPGTSDHFVPWLRVSREPSSVHRRSDSVHSFEESRHQGI